MMENQIQPIDMPPREVVEDEPETVAASEYIRVRAPEDPTPEQRMRIIEVSGTLDFWDRPEEDVYSADDGEAV